MATFHNLHTPCKGRDCSAEADVYALDPCPNGWADWYCHACTPTNWIIGDTIIKKEKK